MKKTTLLENTYNETLALCENFSNTNNINLPTVKSLLGKIAQAPDLWEIDRELAQQFGYKFISDMEDNCDKVDDSDIDWAVENLNKYEEMYNYIKDVEETLEEIAHALTTIAMFARG